MHKDTHEVLPLAWSLDLPTGMRDAASKHAQRMGWAPNVIERDSMYHMYMRSLALISLAFYDSVKVVHDDGTKLYVIMNESFADNDIAFLRRLIETSEYFPDAVLDDLLHNNQCVFTVDDPTQPEIKARYTPASVDSGEEGVPEVRRLIAEHGLKNICFSIFYAEVEEVEDVAYEFQNGVPLDLPSYVRHCRADPLFAIQELSIVERYFKRTRVEAS